MSRWGKHLESFGKADPVRDWARVSGRGGAGPVRDAGRFGASAIGLADAGDARVGGAEGGWAVGVPALGWAVCGGDGVGVVGWGFTPPMVRVAGRGWWGGTSPYGFLVLFC